MPASSASLSLALAMIASLVLSTMALGPAPVRLGDACDFTILAKTGISNGPPSFISGDIGVSPISYAAMTGFDLVKDSSNTFSLEYASQVGGKVYAADYASPTPSRMTSAILSMQDAFDDVASRPDPNFSEYLGGRIDGMTLKAGLYAWTSDLSFNNLLVLKGNSTDVFIFRTSKNLIVGENAQVVIVGDGSSGGRPQATNIFWQVAGDVTVYKGLTHMEGVILSAGAVTFETGSSLSGRILSQTSATLDQATIQAPVDACFR
jgi:hypothetical protein